MYFKAHLCTEIMSDRDNPGLYRFQYISKKLYKSSRNLAIVSTVETGYKNTVGSRKTCSYNRYVLISGVLITGMFLYPVCSYNQYVLITGMFL